MFHQTFYKKYVILLEDCIKGILLKDSKLYTVILDIFSDHLHKFRAWACKKIKLCNEKKNTDSFYFGLILLLWFLAVFDFALVYFYPTCQRVNFLPLWMFSVRAWMSWMTTMTLERKTEGMKRSWFSRTPSRMSPWQLTPAPATYW